MYKNKTAKLIVRNNNENPGQRFINIIKKTCSVEFFSILFLNERQ